MSTQLDLFAVLAEPLDLVAELFSQAKAQASKRKHLFHPAAGHHAANLSMFGFRGYVKALCPTAGAAWDRISYCDQGETA